MTKKEIMASLFKKNRGLFIFLAALAFRLAYVFSVRLLPYYRHLMGDAFSFDQYAWEIVRRSPVSPLLQITLSPVYLTFVSGIYFCFGHHPLAVRIVEAI